MFNLVKDNSQSDPFFYGETMTSMRTKELFFCMRITENVRSDARKRIYYVGKMTLAWMKISFS